MNLEWQGEHNNSDLPSCKSRKGPELIQEISRAAVDSDPIGLVLELLEFRQIRGVHKVQLLPFPRTLDEDLRCIREVIAVHGDGLVGLAIEQNCLNLLNIASVRGKVPLVIHGDGREGLLQSNVHVLQALEHLGHHGLLKPSFRKRFKLIADLLARLVLYQASNG